MIKLTINSPILGLDGNPLIPESKMNQLVANILAIGNSGEPAKFVNWARLFFNGETVLVDESDYAKILSAIKKQESVTDLAKAQILDALKGCHDEYKKAKN